MKATKKDIKDLWTLFLLLWMFGSIGFWEYTKDVLPGPAQFGASIVVLFGVWVYLRSKYDKAEK